MHACRTALIFALATAAPAMAAAGPAGKVVIAQGADPSTLDLMNVIEAPAFNVGSQVFETLVARDESLRLIPALAQELPRSISPTVWEISLRKGVRFHNGEDFDAESVKFSLERLFTPANNLRATPRPNIFDRVEIVDPYTVRVHTTQPAPVFVKGLIVGPVAMYPPRAYAGKDSAFISKNPIGTGPYRFVRWSKDEEIVLEANPSYWGGAPRIKTVVFRPIPDDAVRIAALQKGEVDLAVNIPPNLANIVAAHPRLFVSTAPSIRTIQLMFYTHRFDADHKVMGAYAGPTADRRVRQAIAAAIDPDEIIAGVLDGKGKRVATLLTSFHFGFDPSLVPLKRDLERAKRLLAEAGHANGLDLTLNGPQGRYVRDKEVAESIAGQLAKVDIRTRVQTYEFVTFMTNLTYVHKAGPMYLIGWGVSTLDADTVYRPLFRSGSILANYYNSELDRLVDEARTTMDEGRRLELYHRINKLWLEDVPAVPLYQQVDVYGANKRLVWQARSDELLRAYDMALKQ
jgi:peptide/nickel transport system substrate-binding protein